MSIFEVLPYIQKGCVIDYAEKVCVTLMPLIQFDSFFNSWSMQKAKFSSNCLKALGFCTSRYDTSNLAKDSGKNNAQSPLGNFI